MPFSKIPQFPEMESDGHGDHQDALVSVPQTFEVGNKVNTSGRKYFVWSVLILIVLYPGYYFVFEQDKVIQFIESFFR